MILLVPEELDRMGKCRFAVAFFALCALAQNSGEQAGQGVFRITSTLIQVDAVVTDHQGHPVTGLKPDDFTIDVDGKTYPVSRATYVWVSQNPAPFLPYRMPNPRGPKEAPAPPAPAPKAEQVRRTIVLMVDDLGLSWESMAGVRTSLQKFVDHQMLPGDLVAILRTGAGSGAVQQFTTDKNLLRSVIDHLRWNPNGIGQVGVFEPLGMQSDLARQIQARAPDTGLYASNSLGVPFDRNAHDAFALRTSLGGTFGALQYVVEALGNMPGRKSVVLFSDGFSLADDNYQHTLGLMLDKLIDTANRSGTVFYTIDARGLVIFSPAGQDRLGRGVQAGEVTNRRAQSFYASQEGLSYLADKTGGLAYQDNDMNYGLTRMLEDQQGYYLLAFKPDASLFSNGSGVPKFNRMSVSVKQSGLHVRSRTGFFGKTDQEMRQAIGTPAEQLRVAMLSPFLSSDIHVQVTALYSAVKDKKPVVRNLVYIDPRDIHFELNAKGESVAKIQLLAVAVGAKDEALAQIANEYTIRALPDVLPKMLDSGLIYSLDVPVPQAGPYQIRAAVRDENTSAIGSAHEYIDVPNIRKDKLGLTSLMLGAAGPQAQNENVMLLAAARRRFAPGDRITFASLLEGPETSSQNQPNVQAEIRLFRNNQESFISPVKLSPLAGNHWGISGSVKLPPDADPGQYYLQVIARDINHPSRLAWQWADFEIIQREAKLLPVNIPGGIY